MINYGYVKPIIEKGHYILGGAQSLPNVILQPTRQWDNFLPLFNPQNVTFETCGCSVWGTINGLEILEKRIYAGTPNYSQRFTYDITNTRPPGNDPHVIAESVRTRGVIIHDELPMTDTFEEFIQPNPMSAKFLTEGLIWTGTNNYGHEWVFDTDIPIQQKTNAIMEALQYSPVCASVTAWFEDPNNPGVYISDGQPNCHWVVIYGTSDKGWKVFDSYDHSLKIYSYDSDIDFAKRYHLVRTVIQSTNPNSLMNVLKRLLSYFKGISGLSTGAL